MCSAKQVTAELSDVLSTAHPWMSFLDIPLFFVTLCNPAERTTMQPALVLGLLAVATLLGSNELEKGHDGRTRACESSKINHSPTRMARSCDLLVWLRDVAQSALEASLNTSWIEPSLAQAAMV